MEAKHILLGRSWQFDRKVIHYGLTNRITLHQKGKYIVLSPLKPQQLRKDQISLKKKLEREKKDEKKKLKKERNLSLEVSVPFQKSCLTKRF